MPHAIIMCVKDTDAKMESASNPTPFVFIFVCKCYLLAPIKLLSVGDVVKVVVLGVEEKKN